MDFQATDKLNFTREDAWLRKGNLKRETESLIIAVQKQRLNDQLC